MAGLLSIVCTPIGNLGDISKRAADTLRSSSVILAENINHSRKLLSALQVDLKNTQMLSCAQQDEEKRIKVVLEKLEAGDHISLISDAGAPSISDPGGRLVDAVIQAGYKIEVIPGPSAVIAALMGAGVISHRFAFLGFLPKKGKERERLIQGSRALGMALVIYESPNRVLATLDSLFELCGPKRVVVARELTKQFETFHRGVLGAELSPPFVPKGEAVIVIEGGEEVEDVSPSLGNLHDHLTTLLAQSDLSSKDIAKRIAKTWDLSSKEAYRLVLERKDLR